MSASVRAFANVGAWDKRVVLQALELARWAPSANNHQPWRVRYAPECLEIVRDAHYAREFLDVNEEATRLAVGMFAETLRLSLGVEGFDAAIDFSHDRESNTWATLHAQAARGVPGDPLALAIVRRVTNRKLYAPGSCTQTELDSLRAAAACRRETAVHFFSELGAMRAIADAVRLCDRVRMVNRRCHEEFHQQTRWTQQISEAAGTGCYAKTYEIKAHEAWMIRLTRAYRAMRVVDTVFRVGSIASKLAYRQVLASGAIGMLEVEDHEPASLLAAGVALQRIWLQATRLGLAFHPIAVTPLLIRMRHVDVGALSAPELRRVAQAETSLDSIDGAPRARNVVMLFRVGRGPAPSARTARLPAAALLVP